MDSIFVVTLPAAGRVMVAVSTSIARRELEIGAVLADQLTSHGGGRLVKLLPDLLDV